MPCLVSDESMDTQGVANVRLLVSNQSVFVARCSDCHETLGADGFDDTISVVPVAECGSRLMEHGGPRSGIFWP